MTIKLESRRSPHNTARTAQRAGDSAVWTLEDIYSFADPDVVMETESLQPGRTFVGLMEDVEKEFGVAIDTRFMKLLTLSLQTIIYEIAFASKVRDQGAGAIKIDVREKKAKLLC